MYDVKNFNLLRLARRIEREAAVDLTQRRAWHVDLTLTTTAIKWVSGAQPIYGLIASVALTAGQVVYQDTADTLIKAARANAVATVTNVLGIVLAAAQAGGQTIIAPNSARINIGATCTAGTNYCISAGAAGAIAPWADLGTGNYVYNLFIGEGTNNVNLNFNLGPVVHA